MSLKNYQYPDQFGKWLGYKFKKLNRGKMTAEAELVIRKSHLSPAKRVHGGVVSAFLDSTFGAAVFSTMGPRDYCSTVELKVNYLKPLELGDRLRAVATVVFRGKKLCVLYGFVYRNREKKPAALATATFNVITYEATR